MDWAEIKELLCQQLQLLAKKSETADAETLTALTKAMCEIAEVLD